MKIMNFFRQGCSCTVMLLVVLSSSLAWGAALFTQEWESIPPNTGAPWSYTSGIPTIDCSVPPSPSGGCALRFVYAAGTYSSSFSGGRMGANFSELTELYWGHWNRYSSGFVWNGNGTKMDFLVLAQKDGCNVGGNMAVGWKGDPYAPTSVPTNQIGDASCGGFGTQDYWGSSYTAQTNQWVWIEEHFRINTTGVADGLFEMWVNGILVQRNTNVPYRNPGVVSGWNQIVHTAEWGGGGGTVPATQYWWVDHTVLSTTRIGMPGTTPSGGDSTPPSPPFGLRVQ